MPSPIETISRIARSEKRANAIVFFLFFSRFEYALKREGFARGTGQNADEASADWNKYADKHPELLDQQQSELFISAICNLRKAPPMKQMLDPEKRLTWMADNYTGQFNLARIFVLLCRIRNNLFHGGKFPVGIIGEVSRDCELLDAGITIMQACLDRDTELMHRFLEHFE